MRTPHAATVNLTCEECGHGYQVPFDAIREPVTCPSCGDVSQFAEPAIARIEQAFGEALSTASGASAIDGIQTGAADVRKD